jgi:uncharacterized protein YjbI with pentapeptide repeats
MADRNVDPEKCAEDGCIGILLSTGGRCWAHASEQDLDAALKRLGEDGHVDARGVPITNELLKRLLAAAPKDDHGRPVLTKPQFDRAAFEGKASIKDGPGFYGTVFKGTAGFFGTTFEGTASLGGATFEGDVGFTGATFNGTADFHGATFKGETWFDGVTFKSEARFVEARFQRDADFDQAIFHGDAWFNGAMANRGAYFVGATFRHARQLGPMLVRKSLVLDGAVFHERAQIQVAAAAVCCQRARFLAGLQLRARFAEIVLDDADLAAPSLLTGADAFAGLDEGRWALALARLTISNGLMVETPDFPVMVIQDLYGPGGAMPDIVLAEQPRLLSVRGADVAGLTIANTDLRACLFAGAYHLDQLRIEGCEFAVAPGGWRWTTRKTIAEEHRWRQPPPATGSRAKPLAWYRPQHRPPSWLEAKGRSNGLDALEAGQIASLYRALRKGREDAKDEPGAADFYYGEMEMRRHNPDTPRAERLVLWLYWLVAGYGLRAWRALAALAVVIGLVGLGFSRVGFHHPHPSQIASWLYALQATVSLEGKARQLSGQLTLPGELLRVGLRLAGPLLLGLATLSIRGRIKR